MRSIFIPDEYSDYLKNSENVTFGIYAFPIIDMLVLGVILLITYIASMSLEVEKISTIIYITIIIMFLYSAIFQISLSPSHTMSKKIRHSIVVRNQNKITIIEKTDVRYKRKSSSDGGIDLRSLCGIDEEIAIQRRVSDELKKYFQESISYVNSSYFVKEYINVKIVKEHKFYYVMSGEVQENKKYRKVNFKLYKAYVGMDLLMEGLRWKNILFKK